MAIRLLDRLISADRAATQGHRRRLLSATRPVAAPLAVGTLFGDILCLEVTPQ